MLNSLGTLILLFVGNLPVRYGDLAAVRQTIPSRGRVNVDGGDVHLDAHFECLDDGPVQRGHDHQRDHQ